MAFQLIDDILDFTARETVLGKPVGNDLREGKITLPVIYALQDCTREERRLIESVVRDRNYDHVSTSTVVHILDRHRAIGKAKERAHSFAEKGRAVMQDFPDSPYQRALLDVADLITAREY